MTKRKRSITPVDPFTQRTLIDDLRRTTKKQPDPPPSVFSAITDGDATISLNWPGIKASISVGPDGEFLLGEFVSQLASELLPPTGELREKLKDALNERARAHNWTFERAERYAILDVLNDAVEITGKQQWKGRIGATRKGNEFVSAVPDDAAPVGYMKWLQQEVLKLARQELLQDLQPDNEEDISGTDTERPREFGRRDPVLEAVGEESDEEKKAPTVDTKRLAFAVSTFTPKELLVFLADMPAKLYSFGAGLCEIAEDEHAMQPLSDDQLRILDADFESDRAISAATKIPAASVPQFGKDYVAKLGRVVGAQWTRRAWRELMHRSEE